MVFMDNTVAIGFCLFIPLGVEYLVTATIIVVVIREVTVWVKRMKILGATTTTTTAATTAAAVAPVAAHTIATVHHIVGIVYST